ncbi:MAG: HDIG domain-containing metalloprotein [Planctomycetota bacterium]
MSLLLRIRSRLEGRHHLRRVSLSKARPSAAAPGVAPLSQLGEKVTTAAIAAAGAVALLGLGTVSGVRQWLALAAAGTLVFAGLLRYLADFRREALGSLSRVVGLAVIMLLPLAIVVVWERVGEGPDLAWLPLSFFSLILALTWGRALALDATVISGVLLLAFLALRGQLDGPLLGGLAISVGGGLAAVLGARSVKRRAALFRIGLMIGSVQAALAATFLLLDPTLAPSLADVWALLRIGLFGVTVGLLVSGLLPAIETLFGVTTDISLLELGNTNESPLLRKLLLEGAGTFHHSYIVGLLSEAAAESVGADALLARVGALYHDVGKLNKPEYFAENSHDARERHRALAPEMSMLIISAHTRDGVELGRYYGLPQAILAFMVEHHGTSRIDYFYHRAVEQRGEENVSEPSFRYSGSKPQSRETAIVMLADAAEAISRQMPDPTRARLEEMVHKVAMKRLVDGQFSECGLTLEELTKIEAAFVQVLCAIYHTRATYQKGKPHPLDLSQPGAAPDICGVGKRAAAPRRREPVSGGRRQ